MGSIPELNTRETALVVWVVIFFVVMLTKPAVRQSFGSLLKLILTSAWLSGVLAATGAYAAGTIVLLQHFGYWENSMVRTAVLWFLGVAVVSIFNTKRTGARYWRHFLLDNLALAAFVEFVTNLHTFPLLVELMLVPLAFVFIAMQALAETNPEYAAVGKLITGCLILLGLAALSFSIAYLASSLAELATAEKVKEFLLPLILTACFVPYLYVVRMITVWQTMLHMIRFGLRENEPLYRFTRRAIIGLSLARAQFFEEMYRRRLWGATDEEEVSHLIRKVRKVWRRRTQQTGVRRLRGLAG
jgi:hypothetical protein